MAGRKLSLGCFSGGSYDGRRVIALRRVLAAALLLALCGAPPPVADAGALERPRVSKGELAAAAYRQLKQDILSFRLAPEAVVLAPEQAERLGMSRAPVHEALKALCQEGLMRVVPRFGYIVTAITRSDIEDVFELRLMLEVPAPRSRPSASASERSGFCASSTNAPEQMRTTPRSMIPPTSSR